MQNKTPEAHKAYVNLARNKKSFNVDKSYIKKLFLNKGIDASSITKEDIERKQEEIKLKRKVLKTKIKNFKSKSDKVERMLYNVGLSEEEYNYRLSILPDELKNVNKENIELKKKINENKQKIKKLLSEIENRMREEEGNLHFVRNFETKKVEVITDNGIVIDMVDFTKEDNQLRIGEE